MVKGVNKTVIEINNTGSKVFDRIVFYVSPQYGNLSTKNLNRAVRDFTLQMDGRSSGLGYNTIRQRRIARRRMIIAAVATVVVLSCVVTLILVL